MRAQFLPLALATLLGLPAVAAATPHGDALARFLDEAAAEEAAEYDDEGEAQFRELATIARRTGTIRREDFPKRWTESIRRGGEFAHPHARLLLLESKLAGQSAAVVQSRPEAIAHAAVDLMHARHELSEFIVHRNSASKYLDHAETDLGLLGGDTDGDGILDAVDKCPTVPEDKDGFQDEDGCPDPDNDGDGILDVNDKCPNEPEDKDGFQDGDGCPDPDNDGDGILDVNDKCPNEPETKNGVLDDDGCPDVLGPVHFASDSSRLDVYAMDALRDTIVALSSGATLRLEGHADSQNGAAYNQALGLRRANAVKDYLVRAAGIKASQLTVASFGDTRPLADNGTDAGRAKNRRVEIVIVGAGR